MESISPGFIPKYRQLLNILRAQIISGQLAPDQRLPTEEELTATYGLSRGTVRKAIEQLEAERLIRTEQGWVLSFRRCIPGQSVSLRGSGRLVASFRSAGRP